LYHPRVQDPPAASEIEWLTRAFEVVVRGSSIFDPGVFRSFSDVLAMRVPHDRLAVVVFDRGTQELRLVVRADRVPATPSASRPNAPILRPTEAQLAALGSREPVVCDDAKTGGSPLDPEFVRAGVASYAIVPIPLEAEGQCAWLVMCWSAPGQASRAPLTAVKRASWMLRAAVPSAQHNARAEQLAQMVDRLPHGVVALDGRLRVVAINAAAQALLEGTGGPLAGRPFPALLTPASREAFADLVAAGRQVGPRLLELALADGGARPLDACVTPVDDEGAVTYQLHLEDARARLASEAELASRTEALAFLRDLAETVAGELNAREACGRAAALIVQRLPVRGIAIAQVNPGGALTLLATEGVGPAALAHFLALRQLEAPSVPPALREALGEGEVLLVPLRHADQLVGLVMFSTAPGLPAATRELLLSGARTMAVALHASVEYADAVRHAAERRQLLDSIPSIVFRLDPETGATLYANAVVERVLGTPVNRALGLPGLEGLLADAVERENMALARALVAGGAESSWVDRRFLRSDGRALTLRTRLYRVEHPGMPGRVLIEGIAQDVTEEHEARRQLVQADRLASLGMLAAGVAHEINNPTTFILLGVQQLGRMVGQMPSDDEALAPLQRRMNEVLSELSDGVQRIVQIVGELKLFARIPEQAFSTPVDVNRLLVSAVTLVRAELRHRARVDLDLGDLPPLPGDHARLGQVFVNLLINAAQAIPPGNEENNRVTVRTRFQDGCITVEVSDTGVGIAPEHLPRIFDPFFTTKAPGEGTGLGLAISYDLVRRAGGTIDVRSEVNRGTDFVVVLPVREAAAPRNSRPRRTPVPRGARVLIVEDEQHLAVAIARALAASYMVELVYDADAALQRIGTGGAGEFDAVLCDLRMPGMDGRALYEAVRLRWPRLAGRFVFLTGAGLGSEYEPFVRATDRPVLEKPFEMAELEEIVAQVVATN
jgi:PAS domain S-box-containing protein